MEEKEIDKLWEAIMALQDRIGNLEMKNLEDKDKKEAFS